MKFALLTPAALIMYLRGLMVRIKKYGLVNLVAIMTAGAGRHMIYASCIRLPGDLTDRPAAVCEIALPEISLKRLLLPGPLLRDDVPDPDALVLSPE